MATKKTKVTVFSCLDCGGEWTPKLKPGQSTACPRCGKSDRLTSKEVKKSDG